MHFEYFIWIYVFDKEWWQLRVKEKVPDTDENKFHNISWLTKICVSFEKELGLWAFSAGNQLCFVNEFQLKIEVLFS